MAELERQLATVDSNESRPPENSVQNFRVANYFDYEVRFLWDHIIEGDYNQDGWVSASDLAVIGRNFGGHEGGANWFYAKLADGDKNGVVDIADIVPIARHYQQNVDLYSLQFLHDDGVWREVKTVPYEQMVTKFSQIEVSGYGNVQAGPSVFMKGFRIQAVDNAGNYGASCEPIMVADIAPKYVGIDPLPGTYMVGETVTFQVEMTGVEHIYLDWFVSFGEYGFTGGSGDMTSPYEMNIEMLGPGAWTLVVTGGNMLGSFEKLYPFTVIEEPEMMDQLQVLVHDQNMISSDTTGLQTQALVWPDGGWFDVDDSFTLITSIVPTDGKGKVVSGKFAIHFYPDKLELVDHQEVNWDGSVQTSLMLVEPGLAEFSFTVDPDHYPTGGIWSVFTTDWQTLNVGITNVNVHLVEVEYLP